MTALMEQRTWKPVALAHYPHMLPADAKLWDKFIRTNPFPDAKLIYDLHVGTPAPIIENYPANYRKMVHTLSTLRVDVVALCPEETLVFEIKPHASLMAIGQAYSYAQLIRRDIPNFRNPVPVILTDTPAPDTHWLCNRLRIILVQLD